MNRRGRIGRPRKRRRQISSSGNRIRRGRIQATQPRSIVSFPQGRPRGRPWGQRVGSRFSDSAEAAKEVSAFTLVGGLALGPPGLAIGGALGGAYEYSKYR